MQRWFRRRQGPDGDVIELHQRRIYILPTRTGLVFGLVFFTMLLGALNYSNNMGFALAFLLTAVTVVSIHHRQRNLAGLRLTVEGCAPVFAGELIECGVRIVNEGRSCTLADQRRTGWRVDATGRPRRRRQRSAAALPADVPARRTACPVIRVSTRYPFGLFEAWAWLYPDRELMVYPHLPPARDSTAGSVCRSGTRGRNPARQ